MQSGGTLDAVVHQATDTSGSALRKHLDQLESYYPAHPGWSDCNKDVVIEIRSEELDSTDGFDCIALGYTVGTAATMLSIEIYGLEPRYAPVSVTAWDEVVD